MEKEKAEIASLVEKYGRVQSLMKYVNKDTLKESYSKQPKGKAVGADGVTKEEYGKRVEENIENLIVIFLQTIPGTQSLYSKRKWENARTGNPVI